MTTGQSTRPLSEKLAERRAQQLGEVDELTQKLLSEHESDLRQQLSDARRTTESAIHAHSQHLNSALSEVETRQTRHIQTLEKRLASAASQAERLSRVGGLRSWMRPVAITLAVMLTLAGLTASGLLLTDQWIDSRIQKLGYLQNEIQQIENLPRLGNHLEIRTIQGATYLVGDAWTGNLEDGTPVIELTNTRD